MPNMQASLPRAATVAQTEIIQQLSGLIPGKGLVFVTIIPVDYCFPCGTLDEFEIHEFNSVLIGRLQEAKVLRPLIGGVDFSLERTAAGLKYWQPHWHFGTWTNNRPLLLERLKDVFPKSEKYERPVGCNRTPRSGFLSICKQGFQNSPLIAGMDEGICQSFSWR
jgi:hypothetical protein